MRVAVVVVGVLVLLAGAVFAGQGLGYIKVADSVMTGDMKWFWIGGGMVVVGLLLGGGGLLRRVPRA